MSESSVAAKFHCDNTYYQRPLDPTMRIKDALEHFKLERHKILYFGVEILPETVFSEIQTFIYPDTFMHLVLQPI